MEKQTFLCILDPVCFWSTNLYTYNLLRVLLQCHAQTHPQYPGKFRSVQHSVEQNLTSAMALTAIRLPLCFMRAMTYCDSHGASTPLKHTISNDCSSRDFPALTQSIYGTLNFNFNILFVCILHSNMNEADALKCYFCPSILSVKHSLQENGTNRKQLGYQA